MGNLQEAFRTIDQLNNADPNLDGGKPKEWLYGVRMTEVLNEFHPGPSENLQIAARAQHVCRWQISRVDFPQGRSGYYQWRKACQGMHVEKTMEIMEQAGYSSADRDAVAAMLRKDGLRSSPDVQTIEDVACLVFLQFYAADFAAKHPREKVADILRKTWKKMSSGAQEAAMDCSLPADMVACVS